MRADMAKVLVERPRVRAGFVRGLCGKGYNTRVRKALESDDGGPCHEPTMRRYNGRGDKHFNEHLGPLRRFLDANVGRPWAKVYSEICRHVDRGNVVQKHILTHLFEYVVLNPEVIGGEVYRRPHERRYSFRGGPLRGPNRWYVCPKSKLLKRAKVEPRTERRKFRWIDTTPPLPPLVWVSKTQFVRRLTGDYWQMVTVKPWPEPTPFPAPGITPPLDVLFQTRLHRLDFGRAKQFYGRPVYAVAVRRMQLRELESLPITLPPKLTAPNVVR